MWLTVKRFLVKVVLFVLGMTGFGAIGIMEKEVTLSPAMEISLSPAMKVPEREEIIIDEFPFDESEPYSLVLTPKDEKNGTYELRLYDQDGRILQQLSCDKMEDPILSTEYACMVFIGNERKMIRILNTDDTVQVYEWDGSRFSEADVSMIPSYRDGVLKEETENYKIESIYEYNEKQRLAEEIRRETLQKDTGMLEIWDYAADECLFQSIVEHDDGIITGNFMYYDKLFWDDLYTWTDEEQIFFGWPEGEDGEIYIKSYESRETFLAENGFENMEPVYQYYNWNHKLYMELFKEESRERFCGIVYECYCYSEKGETWPSVMNGYIINGMIEKKWNDEDTSSETAGYIDYVYRDDGTLFYTYYFTKDIDVLDEAYISRESYYDEKGRVVYEYENGRLKKYYIYEGEGKIPAYCLSVDEEHDLEGHPDIYLIQYHG